MALRSTKPTYTSTKIRLTHPEKVLDPESGLTKQQLADYYAAVADRMLPHIADRPLSLVRCPDGAGKPCFFQKHINSMLPPGIGSIDITDKKSGKPEPYITLNTPEALISLAQLGVLEIHPWGSKNNDLEHPDRLIFDLDPDESLPWSTLALAAAEVRKRLKKAGLESFLKLTGGKGLHIVAPIQPTLTWLELKTAAHTLVLSMERDNPALYLSKMTKSARTGKIYLDYLRNERGATAVAPYSPRARLGAHVSLPLPWSALNETARPVFSVRDLDAWRSRLRSDPWKALPSTKQQLLPTEFDAL
jgi:bifunctional non-homologous end joining protein LigD